MGININLITGIFQVKSPAQNFKIAQNFVTRRKHVPKILGFISWRKHVPKILGRYLHK